MNIIGISEVHKWEHDNRLNLEGYHPMLKKTREDDDRGDVALFIKNSITYKIREDLSIFIPHITESLFIECELQNKHKVIVGVIYRPNSAPKADLDIC